MIEILNDGFWLVLLGISLLYSLVIRTIISTRKSKKIGIPVISVGNIHLGGTGKTPLVIKLTQHFQDLKPAVASRGYKSRVTRVGAKCDLSEKNGPRVFGDEPWLIAQKTGCEVFVGKNRVKTLSRFQVEKTHSLVILDDGFQHTQLEREVDLVLIPGELDPTRSACLPLGTLREPLTSLRRASAVVVTCGAEASTPLEAWKNLLQQITPDLPCFVAKRLPIRILSCEGAEVDSQSQCWGAFCGIARPGRFFTDLRNWGRIQTELTFPDHHEYTKADIHQLIETGKRKGISAWITTEKDYVKAAPLFDALSIEYQALFYAPVEYDYPLDLFTFIEQKLGVT